jgi:hypothetical protein
MLSKLVTPPEESKVLAVGCCRTLIPEVAPGGGYFATGALTSFLPPAYVILRRPDCTPLVGPAACPSNSEEVEDSPVDGGFSQKYDGADVSL